MRDAVERARNGEGPSLIHIKTARFYGHFVGDAQTYRADGEIEKLRAENDCLKVFREKVVETGLLTDKQLDDIFEEARERGPGCRVSLSGSTPCHRGRSHDRRLRLLLTGRTDSA